jgi:hypothetical protein
MDENIREQIIATALILACDFIKQNCKLPDNANHEFMQSLFYDEIMSYFLRQAEKQIGFSILDIAKEDK